MLSRNRCGFAIGASGSDKRIKEGARSVVCDDWKDLWRATARSFRDLLANLNPLLDFKRFSPEPLEH
jgi:hypothetical protein